MDTENIELLVTLGSGQTAAEAIEAIYHCLLYTSDAADE